MNNSSVPGFGTRMSATFLVGGTCIGAGMLALPVAAGVGGFLPSVVWLTISWLMMCASALLLAEATLWMEEGSHVISMAKRFLGPIGQVVSWFLYLYIAYASLVSYASGGGLIISSFINSFAGTALTKTEGIWILSLFCILVIYLGSKIVGRINTLFFFCIILSYLLLVGMGVDEIRPELLESTSWITSTLSLPLLLTSFSFQTMIPSLVPYLNRNAKALRHALIGGTFIAFLIYFVWLLVILGIVPVDGEMGLIKAYILGVPATEFVSEHVHGFWIAKIVSFFAFFSITTSFFGIGLGLFDFLSDGLHIKEKGFGKIILGLALLVPTVFFAIYFERAFLVAMETTGGIGDAILNGVIPILMVWVGRYYMNLKSDHPLPGGKPFLTLLCLCFLAIAVWECVMLTTPIVAQLLGI